MNKHDKHSNEGQDTLQELVEGGKPDKSTDSTAFQILHVENEE